MSSVSTLRAIKALDPAILTDARSSLTTLLTEDGAINAHAWLGSVGEEHVPGVALFGFRAYDRSGETRCGVLLDSDGRLELVVSSICGGEFMPLVTTCLNCGNGAGAIGPRMAHEPDATRHALGLRLSRCLEAMARLPLAA